ncbi:GH20911 [Drosophila grimshawi]|uniref:GH20911 n=1 Tax=Drosophila grimshawi TaxID=7222 RepID=B4J4S7_DROGR|nr:GH20911 [Drosophila grimshawi]
MLLQQNGMEQRLKKQKKNKKTKKKKKQEQEQNTWTVPKVRQRLFKSLSSWQQNGCVRCSPQLKAKLPFAAKLFFVKSCSNSSNGHCNNNNNNNNSNGK